MTALSMSSTLAPRTAMSMLWQQITGISNGNLILTQRYMHPRPLDKTVASMWANAGLRILILPMEKNIILNFTASTRMERNTGVIEREQAFIHPPPLAPTGPSTRAHGMDTFLL